MKKILALVIALCLLCGGAAVADATTINQDSVSRTANTTVSYTIATCEDYTVTIPSAVTLTAGEDSKLTGKMTVGLDCPKFNVAGKGVDVTLS